MSCSEIRSLIGGYVLQALDPSEADAVRAHLRTCAECARDHAELAPLPALLDTAHEADAVHVDPPPALEEAVIDRFARERPANAPRPRERGRRRLRWLGRPVPAAIAAAAVAVAATLAISGALGGSDDSPAHVYGAHLKGPAPAPGADEPYAYARLSSFDAGTKVHLKVSGVPAKPGTVYELWCVYPDGTKVSAGTFVVDAEGRAEVDMTTAARVGDYHRLTVERHAPGKPGERVMLGDIAY